MACRLLLSLLFLAVAQGATPAEDVAVLAEETTPTRAPSRPVLVHTSSASERPTTEVTTATPTPEASTTAVSTVAASGSEELRRQCEDAMQAWSPWTTKAENIVSSACGVRRRSRKFRKTTSEDLVRRCQESTDLENTQYKDFCSMLSRNENLEVIQYYFVNAVFGYAADASNLAALQEAALQEERRRRKRFIDFDADVFDHVIPGFCPEDKKERPVDFLIMLDKSGSMLLKHFRLLLRSMKFLVTNGIPNVSPDATRIAMVTFANNPTVEFTFDQCANKSCVVDEIYGATFNGGLTRMAVALDKVNELFDTKHGMRKCSRRVVLLVTDGSSSEYDHLNPEEPASILKNTKDVEIFVVGISKLINEVQLQSIGSYPVLTHLYYMPNVRQARRVFKKIKTATAADL